MMVPCVSCQSMFRLDGTYIKETGTQVRCSNCHDVFMVFPPANDTEPCPENGHSKADVAVVIPKVRHSLLDDLFQVQTQPNAMATSAGISEGSENYPIDDIQPFEDFEEVEEDEPIEHAELPDLFEIEEIVDLRPAVGMKRPLMQ
ncbi:MAG: zinc-ribbon domain-containing protein [Desulfobacterales bacterium]